MLLPDWQLVRHLSQLSLLNRIAFVMLFVVPLLCGILKPVQSTAGKYNDVVGGTRDRILEVELLPEGVGTVVDAVRELESLANSDGEGQGGQADEEEPQETEIRKASLPLGQLKPVRGIIVGGFPWSIAIPYLPRPWGMAFLAALLILLGDTIVQCRCPSIVRKASVDEYSQAQATHFTKCPSEAYLSEVRADLSPYEAQAELLDREHELTKSLLEKEYPSQFEMDNLGQLRVSMVEAVSQIRYRAAARTRRMAATVSLLSYSVAGIIVIKILQEQTVNVLRSLGWVA